MSRCIPSINPALSIPELIKIMKHSYRECDFDEVQNILIEREKKMKIEIENLQMDNSRLLEKFAELEKLKLEEKLQRSRRKCKLLNETITSLDSRLVKMREEIEDLKQEKEKLKCQNLEATKALDELRREKRESDKLSKLYESSLEPRIMKVEGALANMLNLKVEDLANLVTTLEMCDATTKGENVDIDSGDRNLVHSWIKEDVANTVRIYPGSQSGGSPPCVESNGAAQDNEGEERVSGVKNLVHSRTNEDGANRTSPGSHSGGSPRGATDFRHERKMTSGAQAGDLIEIRDSDDEANHGDAIRVSDTSSEQIDKRERRDCRGDSPVNLIRKTKRRICISEEEDDVPTDEKENQVLESIHDRIAPLNDVPISGTSPHYTPPSEPPCDDSQTSLQNVHSTDSDDESSYSDDHMERLVATVQIKC